MPTAGCLSPSRGVKPLAGLSAVLLALALFAAGPAEARLGGGGSFGSRGTRTFSMPSATPTAPRIAPIGRSQTAAPFNNGYGGYGGARPGFFGGGFGRGLLGGFLGAGLFGLLFGNGFAGGLGGGLSLIGLLLQLGLLYFLFRLAMGFFRGQQFAFGGGAQRTGFAGPSAFAGGGGALPGGATRGVPITVGPEDYATFERRLVDSQLAYSNGDVRALREITTAEMANEFAGELASNQRQGVVNKIADVQLLQGDLSEAWREGNTEYATVAMRFSLVDATLETGSGRVVSGDAQRPQQVTEIWTFVRAAGAGPNGWALSAIQQG